MAAAGWLEVLMSALLLAALACVLVASLIVPLHQHKTRRSEASGPTDPRKHVPPSI
jgi:nucleoside permease NupC